MPDRSDRPEPPVLRACAAVIRDEKILMVRHVYEGRSYWTLPSGRIDEGESPEAAAERELLEETGLTGQVVRLLFDEDFLDGLCRCFLLELTGSSEAVLGHDPEEAHLEVHQKMLQELAWQPLESFKNDSQVAQVILALKL